MDIEQKLIKFTPAMCQRHDICVSLLGPLLDIAGHKMRLSAHEDAALQWAIIESLCLMVGKRLGLPVRVIAEEVESIAVNIIREGDK